jgi:CRP-like cAMP-binding protein
MKQISCKSCTNTNCFIKKHCSDEWLREPDGKKSQTHYRKHQHVIHEDSTVQGIYFIQKGKVKVFLTGLNGRPQIVRFANDGHILGHRGLEGKDRYPISASAMDNSLICHIDNEMLNQLFKSNFEFVIGLMQFYSRELRKADERIKNLTQMNVREKIADALLVLYDNFGLNTQKELDVAFSREDIANTAGTSISQVALHLGDLEKENLIERRGNKIIALLNLPGLMHIINEHNLHLITQ